MSPLKNLSVTLFTPSPHLYEDHSHRERNIFAYVVPVVTIISAIQQNDAVSIRVGLVSSSVT